VILLQSPPKKLSRAATREQCVVVFCHQLISLTEFRRRAAARAQILRATAPHSPLPPLFYMSISQNLCEAFEAGSYLKDGPPKRGDSSAPLNPLTDPSAMDGMMAGMKTQMVMMVPQMVIMGWINFFFQGFLLSMSFSTIEAAASVQSRMKSNFSQTSVPFDLWIQVYASAWH